MVHDAEALLDDLTPQSLYSDRRLFKVKDDPRVTRLGNFLRRTSLDELPQLWNAFVGNMSLVGPRPPLPSEVDLYEEHHYTRFDVKPGITGPWQVNGRNTITDFEEVIRLETDYIREWTIWKDLGILLRTVPAVVLMRGSALATLEAAPSTSDLYFSRPVRKQSKAHSTTAVNSRRKRSGAKRSAFSRHAAGLILLDSRSNSSTAPITDEADCSLK